MGGNHHGAPALPTRPAPSPSCVSFSSFTDPVLGSDAKVNRAELLPSTTMMQTDQQQGDTGLIKDVTEAKPVLFPVRMWKGISEKGVAPLNPRQGKDGEGRSPEHNHKQEQDEGGQRKTRQGESGHQSWVGR